MRRGAERGQTSAEYLGLVLVVSVIIGALATSGIGSTISRAVQDRICAISGGSCSGGPSQAGGSAPSAPRPGAPSAPGVLPGAVVPPVTPRVPSDPRAPGDRDGVDPGPGRGSPTDRGPDGRSGSAGERPRGSGGQGPPPEGGGSGVQAPPSGVETGPSGGPVPPPFDPPKPDSGSGEHGSEGAGIADRINKEKWYAAADAAEALGYTDAARHLRHYLDNSGDPLKVDVGSILEEESGLREAVGNQVDLATREAFKGYDGKGPVDIPFRTDWRVFTAHGKNWFYGLGSFSHSVTGTVHIEPGSPPRTTVTYRIHVHDRYNWDGTKSTDIGPFNIKDKELQALHRKGLAQEFDVDGTSDETTVTVDPDKPGSGAPPAGDGRDGSRGDPGRSRG